jgi:hypothetical protein
MQKILVLIFVLFSAQLASAQLADTLQIINRNATSRAIMNGSLTISSDSSAFYPGSLVQLDPVGKALKWYNLSNGNNVFNQSLDFNGYDETDILTIETNQSSTSASAAILVVSASNSSLMYYFRGNYLSVYGGIHDYQSQAVAFSRLAKDEKGNTYAYDVNSKDIIKFTVNISSPSITLDSHISLDAITNSNADPIRDFGVWDNNFYVITRNTIYRVNSSGSIVSSYNVNTQNTFGETVNLDRMHVDPNGRLVITANGLPQGAAKQIGGQTTANQGQYILFMWRDLSKVLATLDVKTAGIRGNYDYVKDVFVHTDGSMFIGEGTSLKVHRLNYLNHAPLGRSDFVVGTKTFEVNGMNEGSITRLTREHFEFADYNFHQKLDSIRIRPQAHSALGDFYFDENNNGIYETSEKVVAFYDKKIAVEALDNGQIVYIGDTSSKTAFNQDLLATNVSDGVDWSGNIQFIYGHMYPKKLKINGVQGKDQWRLLANFRENQTIGSFLEPLWTQGATGSDAPTEDPTVFRYSTPDETWTAVTNFSDTLALQEALLVYIYEDDDPTVAGVQGGWPKYLTPDSTKTIMYKRYSTDMKYRRYQLDYSTNLGANAQYRGFNLKGNITGMINDFSAVNNNQFIQNAFYTWNPTLNNGNGGYEFWTTGGGTRGSALIYPGEAVWFKATANNAFVNIATSSFVVGDFVAPKENPEDKRFQFVLSDDGFQDRVILAPNSTLEVQKMTSLSSNYHEVYIKSEQPLIQQGVELNDVVSIPIGVRSSVLDKATLTFTKPTDYAGYVYLKVAKDGQENFYELNDAVALSLVQENGVWKEDGELSLIFQSEQITSVEEEQAELPASFYVSTYPNPFNPTTTLNVDLPVQTRLTIEVFDITGRLIQTLAKNQSRVAGSYSYQLNMAGQSSGLYLIRVQTNAQTYVQKITLIK